MKHQDKFTKKSLLLGATLLLAACGPKNDQQAGNLNQIESDSTTLLAQEIKPQTPDESEQVGLESSPVQEAQIASESETQSSIIPSQAGEGSGQFVDGIYQAVGAPNELGWKVQQILTITNGKISDIQFDYVNADNIYMSQDTEYNMQMKQALGRTAIETINNLEESFLKAPDREVDTISGATQMSNDFKTSLELVKEAARRGDTQIQSIDPVTSESYSASDEGYQLGSQDESESSFIQVIEDESESTTTSTGVIFADPAQSITTQEATTTSQTTTIEPESLFDEESMSESESESGDETSSDEMVASLMTTDETSQDESLAEVKREHTVNPKLINMTGTTTTLEATTTAQSTITTETSLEATTTAETSTTETKQITEETTLESRTTTMTETDKDHSESSSDLTSGNRSDETPIFKDGEYHNVMDANDKGWAMTHTIIVENGKIVVSEFDYLDKDGNLMSKDPEVEKEYLKSTGVPTKKLFELMSEAFVREQRADLFTIKGAEDLVADFQASVKAFLKSAESGKTETVKVAPVKKDKEVESHGETTTDSPVTEEAPAEGVETPVEGAGIAN